MSDSQCFVCGAATPPVPSGFRSRASCNNCRARSRLLPSGVPLGQLLTATDRGQLPTDGLSTLLNPLAIDAYRGWAGYAEGDFVIFEERERCKDWFDFVMQHIEPGPQLIEFVSEHKPTLAAPIEGLRAIAKQFGPRVDVWGKLWLMTCACENVLRTQGPIESADDAWKALEAVKQEPTKFDEGYARSMLERLYRIADVEWED